MDPLADRAGDLKGMLVEFGTSDRFRRELSELIEQEFPGRLVTDEAQFTALLDRFLLQHRLAGGTTVVEEFVLARPELPAAERELLLSWRDVVEGMFEVMGKERHAVVLFNVLDELTYRTKSNLGDRALRPFKKGMFVVGRVVPLADDWLVSGHMTLFPARERDRVLGIAAELAMQHPEAVFRNPAKLAEARSLLAEQQKIFTDLFGADLIVVRGSEVPEKVKAFWLRHAEVVSPGQPPNAPVQEFDEEVLAAESCAIHFAEGEGLSFYPDYHLLDELFANPALITRRRHREILSEFLGSPELTPEPLRRLAARDPAKASKVFAGLLKRKRGFSWDADGEELLRRSKPAYFDGTFLPQHIPLSKPLSEAYQRAHAGDK